MLNVHISSTSRPTFYSATEKIEWGGGAGKNLDIEGKTSYLYRPCGIEILKGTNTQHSSHMGQKELLVKYYS